MAHDDRAEKAILEAGANLNSIDAMRDDYLKVMPNNINIHKQNTKQQADEHHDVSFKADK